MIPQLEWNFFGKMCYNPHIPDFSANSPQYHFILTPNFYGFSPWSTHQLLVNPSKPLQFIEVVEFWIWSKSVFTRHKQKKAIKKTKENVCHLNISRVRPWDAIKLSQTNLQWSRKTLNEEPCHPINANWRKWRMFENVLIKKSAFSI